MGNGKEEMRAKEKKEEQIGWRGVEDKECEGKGLGRVSWHVEV